MVLMQDENDGIENANFSIGKRIWLKYFKWIIAGIAVLFGGLIWYIIDRTKKNTIAKQAKDIPYPPDIVAPTPAQINAFNEWTKTNGSAIVANLSANLGKVWINTGEIYDDVKTLSTIADKNLVWVATAYQRKNTGRTLIGDLDAIVLSFYFDRGQEHKTVINRLRKLGAN